MVRIEETIFCDGCGVEITWAPFSVGKRHYCCQDCLYGLCCDCESLEEQEEPAKQAHAGLMRLVSIYQ
jgi:hypothetical protein